MKRAITDITAEQDTYRASVNWRIGMDRFHVWIDSKTGEPEEIVYKNPVAKSGPEHYHTRQLDRINSKATATMFAEVWAVVERDGLLLKAKQEHDAEMVRRRRINELQAERNRIERQVMASWKLEAFNASTLAADLFKDYVRAGREIVKLGGEPEEQKANG